MESPTSRCRFPGRAASAALALVLVSSLAPRSARPQGSPAADLPAEARLSAADLGDATLAYHLARQARAVGDLEQAASLLKIAVDLDPRAILPRIDRVEVLLALNRPTETGALLAPIAAAVDAEARRRPGTAARYHRLRGAVSLRSGEPVAAIDGYEKAVALAPWDLGLRAQLIGLYRATGEPAGAIPHLEAATRALPYNPEIRAELGDALVQLERYVEALAAYRDALELTPPASELHERIERKLDRARSAIER